MKKLLPVFAILFLLSGCSSFYHAHYRRIDKVKATGIRSESSFQNVTESEKIVPGVNDNRIQPTDSLFVLPVTCIEKNDSSVFIRQVQEERIAEEAVSLPKPVSVSETKSVAPHLGEFISVVFLLLSIFAIVAGLSMIILAGVFAEPLFILAGILYILIGGIPFWILLRSLIREKRESGPYEYPH